MLHVFVAFSIICQPVRKLPQRPLVATMLRSGIMGHPSFDLYQKLSTAWKGRDPGLGLDAAAGVALPPGRTSISVDAGWLFFFGFLLHGGQEMRFAKGGLSQMASPSRGVQLSPRWDMRIANSARLRGLGRAPDS